MSVCLCQFPNMIYMYPAFFVQCGAADVCYTFLFVFCAHPLGVSSCFVCYKCCSDDHGQCCLACIMCAGDGAGGRTKPVNSVVYTNTPKLVPAASSHAAILPAKSTAAEDTKPTKSTCVEDTKPAAPASKAATKPAKAAHGFHTRLADKAAVEPTTAVDIQSHGRTAGQSTTEVDIRSSVYYRGGHQVISLLQRWTSGHQSRLGSTFLLSGLPPSLPAPPQSSLPQVKLLGSSP